MHADVVYCTRCRKKGSISKHTVKHESDLGHAQSEQLASARLLEQAEARGSCAITECASLRDEVKQSLKEVIG